MNLTAGTLAHTAQPDRPRREYGWVPIRSLAPRHRARILAHLVRLDERDRYLRFGHAASDAQMAKYVESLNFERDELCGIFNRRLALIGVAHLAFEAGGEMAEFGVSVSPQARGRGFGARLFEWAVLHARNRGIDTLLIHALSENVAMLRLARKAGAVVEREGAESHARLKLPPETFASQVEQRIGSHAAEVDYQFKLRARQVDGLIDALAEVKSQVGGTGKTGTL